MKPGPRRKRESGGGKMIQKNSDLPGSAMKTFGRPSIMSAVKVKVKVNNINQCFTEMVKNLVKAGVPAIIFQTRSGLYEGREGREGREGLAVRAEGNCVSVSHGQNKLIYHFKHELTESPSALDEGIVVLDRAHHTTTQVTHVFYTSDGREQCTYQCHPDKYQRIEAVLYWANSLPSR
jgi:hypothetical protein